MGYNEIQKDEDCGVGGCPVLEKLPKKLRDRLLPFQKEGVRFAVEKNGRCLIADEMGLGKTLQAISVAYLYKDEWPLLIVVPSSLKFCWIEELEKWLPDVLPQEINLVQSGGDISGMSVCPITIITYGLLRQPSNRVIKEALAARRFQVIICDESHYLKNINTLSCKTVVPLLKSARRRILLSGTPALARPVELYSQIDAICPGQFGSYWKYTDRYCAARTVYFGKFKKRQVNGASNLTELQQKLQTIMIRREKSDVLTELPPKQRQRILFELKSSSLKKDILEMFAELKHKIRQGDGNIQTVFQADLALDEALNLPQGGSAAGTESSTGVFQLISQLYRLSGEAKIGPVREYMEMLCEDEQLKFLVFAYHHAMMDGILQTLSEKRVKFVRIDGSTKSCDRQAYVNQFQSDPETRVAILSILAAGVGLTLTAAKLVVFAELYWTPGVMIQCEDRAHRIGQTCSLPVHYLIAKDTMDEWVWSSVCKKTLVTSTALTGTSRRLDHVEGGSHQVELLSNADVWMPDIDDSDVDVTQLVETQRPHDQSSILEFFTSQRSPENTVTRKRKYEVVSQEGVESRTSASAKDRSRSFKDKNVSSELAKRKKRLEDKIPEVITISDEEDEFQPLRKSKKAKSKCAKKKRRDSSRELRNDQTDSKDSRVGVTCNETVPNFDLNFFEDPVNASENSCSAAEEEDRGSVIWDDRGENGQLGMLTHGADDSDDSSSVSDTSLFVPSNKPCQGSGQNIITYVGSDIQVMDSQVKDTTQCNDMLKDAEFKEIQVSSTKFKDEHKIQFTLYSGDENGSDPENEAGASIQQLVASSAGCGHSAGVQNGMPEACDGHSCLRDESQQKVDEAGLDQWPCSVCTFCNHAELSECEMCDTPKKKSASRRHKQVTKGCSPLEKNSYNISVKSKSVYTRQKDAASRFSHLKDNCHDNTSETVDSDQTLASCQASEGSSLPTKASRIKVRSKDSTLWTKRAGRHEHNNNLTCSSSQRLQFGDSQFTTIKTKSDPACSFGNPQGKTQPRVSDKKMHRGSTQTDPCMDTDPSDPESDTIVTSQGHTNNQPRLAVKKDVSGYSSQTSDLFEDSGHRVPKSDLKTVYSLNKLIRCEDQVSSPDVKVTDDSLKCGNSSVSSLIATCKTNDASTRSNFSVVGDSESRIGSFASKSIHSAASDWSKVSEGDTSCVSTPGDDSMSAAPCTQVSSVRPLGTSSPSAEPASGFDPQSTTTTGGEYSVHSGVGTLEAGGSGDQVVHPVLKFCCSSHTGRIFVFDENEQFLQASFQPIDVELGNTDELPRVLQQIHHLRLLKKFVREWSSLTDTKKRLIAKRCQIFTSPLTAYEDIKTTHGSTQRHLNQKDTIERALSNASKVQGSVRMISRKPSTRTDLEAGDQAEPGPGVRSLPQVVTDSGTPLCLQCQRPVSSPLLSAETISNPDNAWQLRLCSFTCMDKYWTLSKASYCRNQLYDVERGICQLCRFDAHALFTHIKVTKSVTARADILMKSPYKTLTQTQRKKMIQDPQAGQFWHADHILPVWQGGGMCDLDNLRTLCSPCHLKVTSKQATQRATSRKLGRAAGQADITAFFQRS